MALKETLVCTVEHLEGVLAAKASSAGFRWRRRASAVHLGSHFPAWNAGR